MGRLANNTQYLVINGVEIDAEFINCRITRSNTSVETTHGADSTHVKRGRGLTDHTFSASIAYLTESAQTVLAALGVDDIVTIEFGEEGNTTGKPRHVQTFNITSIETGKDVKKTAAEFAIQAESTDAPTVDMFNGGVYT